MRKVKQTVKRTDIEVMGVKDRKGPGGDKNTALEKSNFTFLTCLFFQTNTGLGPNITGSDETINEYMKDRVRFTKNEACFSRYIVCLSIDGFYKLLHISPLFPCIP